jgi:hypothetical protein
MKSDNLLNRLASQFEEDSRQIISDEDGLSKNASNMLSRMMYYAKTPFNFGKADRWVKKDILQASARLVDSISDIEENILKRNDKSIPYAVFHSKTFIHNVLNNLAKPLIKLYESENAHLLSIIKEIDSKIEQLEMDLRTNILNVTDDPDNARQYVFYVKSLIAKYKAEVQNFKLTDAINTFEKIEQITSALNKTAGDISKWISRRNLNLVNKDDSSLRLAASDMAAKIEKNLNLFMNSLQSHDDIVSLSSNLYEALENIIEFTKMLIQLSELQNNMMNLQKNKSGKAGAMMVPARDMYFLKLVVRDLVESLNKFKAISGSAA